MTKEEKNAVIAEKVMGWTKGGRMYFHKTGVAVRSKRDFDPCTRWEDCGPAWAKFGEGKCLTLGKSVGMRSNWYALATASVGDSTTGVAKDPLTAMVDCMVKAMEVDGA